MKRALGICFTLACVAACSPAPATAQLDQKDTAAYSSVMKGLLQLPAFAQNAESAPGFCLGINEAGHAEPVGPGAGLLSNVSSTVVPLFPYSECEPRQTPGWGDVRHSPSGKMVGLIVLAPIQWASDGTAKVSLRVDGGPFAAAGFSCSVTQDGHSDCQMDWIS